MRELKSPDVADVRMFNQSTLMMAVGDLLPWDFEIGKREVLLEEKRSEASLQEL
jgi:hypothetical protein